MEKDFEIGLTDAIDQSLRDGSWKLNNPSWVPEKDTDIFQPSRQHTKARSLQESSTVLIQETQKRVAVKSFFHKVFFEFENQCNNEFDLTGKAQKLLEIYEYQKWLKSEKKYDSSLKKLGQMAVLETQVTDLSAFAVEELANSTKALKEAGKDIASQIGMYEQKERWRQNTYFAIAAVDIWYQNH